MPWARNSAPPIFARFLLEHVDEGGADDLALLLGIGRRRRAGRGTGRRRRDAPAGCCSGRGRAVTTSSASPSAQQAGIDEDAGELLAHRLVQQHRRDRGIDAAREAADDAALADLRRDARDRLAAEGRHGPIAAAARDAVGEVLQQRRALRRVHDLGMELHAVEAARVVGDGGEGRALAHARRRGSPAAARRRGRRGSSTPARARPWATARRTARSRPTTSTKARPNSRWSDACDRPPNCAPWSARHSRCRAPARPARTPPAGARGVPASVPRPGRPRG